VTRAIHAMKNTVGPKRDHSQRRSRTAAHVTQERQREKMPNAAAPALPNDKHT